jgi:hypothetical protein
LESTCHCERSAAVQLYGHAQRLDRHASLAMTGLSSLAMTGQSSLSRTDQDLNLMENREDAYPLGDMTPVTPDVIYLLCHPGLDLPHPVTPDAIRGPSPLQPWIPGQARDDVPLSFVTPDMIYLLCHPGLDLPHPVTPDVIRGPSPLQPWLPGQARDDVPLSFVTPDLIRGPCLCMHHCQRQKRPTAATRWARAMPRATVGRSPGVAGPGAVRAATAAAGPGARPGRG